MSSKLFCPMCISGESGSRKRKGHRSSDDSGGSDNDDDNFYRPSKEALKSKTSSISTSDPEQPFHVPSIFKPIRVDSPALFVRGSSSTVSDSRAGGDVQAPDDIASEDENECSARTSGISQVEVKQCGGDKGQKTCDGGKVKEIFCGKETISSSTNANKESEDDKTASASPEKHSKGLSNKSDDISKPFGASPRIKKSKAGSQQSPILNIARARPRPGNEFRKTLLQHKQELPTESLVSSSKQDSILNPDDDDPALDKDRNAECAHSFSSQSSRSLSVNYDSHCPDPEASQPLLLATSELDLVSDEDDEDEEDFEPEEEEPHTTPTANSPHRKQEEKYEPPEKQSDRGDKREKIVIPKIVTDIQEKDMDIKEKKLSMCSATSSKSSTPAPPPLPDCPPPDSDTDCWSRSGSNTRSPSRSRYYAYRNASCSCCTTPSRDHLTSSYGHHHHGGQPCSEFECKGAPDGGYTLSLVDMSQIHYADSASSCCGSDVGDIGEVVGDAMTGNSNNGFARNKELTRRASSPTLITSTVIAPNSSGSATTTIDERHNNPCPSCHQVDENGNRNRCKDAGHDDPNSTLIMAEGHNAATSVARSSGGGGGRDGVLHSKGVVPRLTAATHQTLIKKVSASVNTDIVMPPMYEYDVSKEEMMMTLDRSDSQEELRSASTTPTPPKYEQEQLYEENIMLESSSLPQTPVIKTKGIKSSSITITLKTPQHDRIETLKEENKKLAESDPILWKRAFAKRGEIGYPTNSAHEMMMPMMTTYTPPKNRDDQETRVLSEGFYYSELDLDLALKHKHHQASGKWHYPYHSTGHVPSAEDPRVPLVSDRVEGGDEEEEEEENTIEDSMPLITTTSNVEEEGVDQSPQVHYRGVRTNVSGSWFSLSSSSSLEDYDENELILAYGSGEDSSAATAIASAAAITASLDPEKWSPESSPSLSILSYDEILLEQQKIQQDVQRVVQSVKDNFSDKKDGGHALDLASQSNVQDAFVIAVEQQARERLEKLSALKKIKPVDMTKLSHQLSEAPSESGETSAELNGLIEAATGSPIYVTSASELNSSQSALHRTAATAAAPSAGGSEESQEGKSSPARSTPTSTVITRAVISTGPELSPGKRGHHNNVTVVGVNSSGSTIGGTCLPNGQYSSGGTTASAGDRSTASSVGEPVLPAKKSISKESVNGSRKSGSRESIADSRESVQLEGAKPSPSRSRGSASKLASQSSSRESVIEASSSSQYANMINMVEWDNGPHREMAVDVPDSFVPRNKTPPRYPPTNKTTTLNSNNNKTAGKGVVSDGVAVRGNGTSTLPGHPGQNGAVGKPVPPPRIGDKDGVYGVNNNTTQVPHVTPRTVVGQAKTAATPSRDEAERIRKYQEELKKRREQEEKHAKEEEFLRTSIRGSKKLHALESVREDKTFPTGEPKGFVNQAYDLDGDRISHPLLDITLQKPVGLPELVASLQRVQQALKKHGVQLDEAVSAVGTLMQTPEFQQVLAVHTKVQDVWCFNAPPAPVTAHAQQLNQECLESLYNCSSPASAELVEILSRIDMDGVLHAHDKIAERERLLMTAESPLNAGEPVDAVVIPSSAATPAPPPVPAVPVVGGSHVKSVPRPAFVPEPQPDDHIKVVRIEKTQDPLGATVRNDGDAVVIGRIVKGGAAERSGLLHEGDEILEVNGVEMRGKSVNEVCDILCRMNGTLTFLIVPTQVPQVPIQQRRDILIHVRAHFDYDPEDDIYIPCRELGVAFAKGDVLHVINQEDPNWWQAHREGEEDQQLAGLIPSKSFQEQREAVKQSILGESETREKSKKGTLLCAKTHKKKKKKIPYSSAFNDEFDAEEIPTYEEVALYYPRTSFKRPVVLIGPPNIGRHELRQRLMQESERFAAAVPHTSRSRKDGEIDGQDYHFISRAQFESDILSRKFVEHGEFEKAYYGTSLDAIRSVVNAGKICVLNLHPQSLKILRSSDLKPYIVFIAPPPLERLKQMRIARGEAYKEEELIDIIEKAREMEEKYGHYFDLVIVNNDIERTYHELVQRINYIEREPQWVPAFWLKQ